MIKDTIQTLHPQGKSGRTISRAYYDDMRGAIIEALRPRALTHSELFARLDKALGGTFPGNVSWYAETVKLDLEARRAIVRSNERPPKYHLA